MKKVTGIIFVAFFSVIFMAVAVYMVYYQLKPIGQVQDIRYGFDKSSSNLGSEKPENTDDSLTMVSHSIYWIGEEGQIISRILNYQGISIFDANCSVDILYPNRTFFKIAEPMSYDVGGSYFYKFTIPSTEGVYQYKVVCLYINNTKERSAMSSFQVSPALDFSRVIYDNLSNQIANLSNAEAVHFGELTVNLSQVRADTNYIRNNMQTSADAQIFQNSVISTLNSIANFCGDNVTSASMLCQWVNQSRNMIIDVNITVNQLNNYTQNVIYPAIISLNESISASVNATALIVIESLQANFTQILNSIELLRNSTFMSNETMSARFDAIDSSLVGIRSEVANIENKLDCNNTINILCDRLNAIELNLTQQIADVRQTIVDINISIAEQLARQNEMLSQINQTTQETLYESVNVIEPLLYGLESNLTVIYFDIQSIRDNITLIEENQQDIFDNLTTIQWYVYDIWLNISSGHGDVSQLNYTMNIRFDEINQSLVLIQDSVNMLENKLDCNNTINVICDRLDAIDISISGIISDVGDVMDYLQNNISGRLADIDYHVSQVNDTVTDIYAILSALAKSPSEIDLLIDGIQGDVSRTVGYVNFTIELVNPSISNGTLTLFIDNVPNLTSNAGLLSVAMQLHNGSYVIKAKFDGDLHNAPTTESYVLSVVSGNMIPVVSVTSPQANESINLPYNITYSVSDDNPDDVSLYLFQNGVLNITLATGLPNTQTVFVFSNATPLGVYDLVVVACETGTFDLYCVNASRIFYINLSCVPNWIPAYGVCYINNTQYVEYSDAGMCGTSIGLPIDNGTYVYCDYCVPDIVGPYYLPELCSGNQTQLRYYADYNYASCCIVTGFMSDCAVDYSPYANETVDCSFLQSDITIYADDAPYLHDRIDFIADINISNSTKCFSYVKSENGILQTNPKKTDYSKSLVGSKPTETREYFVPVMGQINGYYTKENLVAYKQFTLGVTCNLDNGTTVTGETLVTPVFDDLRQSTARSVWFVQQMPMLVGMTAFIIFAVVMVLFFFRRKR